MYISNADRHRDDKAQDRRETASTVLVFAAAACVTLAVLLAFDLAGHPILGHVPRSSAIAE